MEVDEEGKEMDGDGKEEKDGEEEDMPDNLNLDNAQEVRNRVNVLLLPCVFHEMASRFVFYVKWCGTDDT